MDSPLGGGVLGGGVVVAGRLAVGPQVTEGGDGALTPLAALVEEEEATPLPIGDDEVVVPTALARGGGGGGVEGGGGGGGGGLLTPPDALITPDALPGEGAALALPRAARATTLEDVDLLGHRIQNDPTPPLGAGGRPAGGALLQAEAPADAVDGGFVAGGQALVGLGLGGDLLRERLLGALLHVAAREGGDEGEGEGEGGGDAAEAAVGLLHGVLSPS